MGRETVLNAQQKERIGSLEALAVELNVVELNATIDTLLDGSCVDSVTTYTIPARFLRFIKCDVCRRNKIAD